jgi:cardiolipin synthase
MANYDQALSRAAGAPLVHGNRIRLLKDAVENYPAWIAAIESAEKWIHFESYIIHDDEAGRQFADLLSAKARQRVKVRVIYDWVGSVGNASYRFWRRMSGAGIEVRCFNRPKPGSPLGWLSRDHRKLISVDGRIAFVTGLCVGQSWIGYPNRNLEPWRDTGVEIEGPAIDEIEKAVAETWALCGDPLPPREFRFPDAIPGAGDVALRVVASVPSSGPIYRLDQLIAALASRSIWLSDAYFIGTAAYVQALRSAAQSGIDVRLLMPGANDVPVMRAIARAGLRPLLEAGIRVFEWNGSMMHAKTAVADGKWARVGSTNLNLTSWLGNFELDVIVEDEPFAQRMEQMFLDDLANSTEIVLKKAAAAHRSSAQVQSSREPQDQQRRQNRCRRVAAESSGRRSNQTSERAGTRPGRTHGLGRTTARSHIVRGGILAACHRLSNRCDVRVDCHIASGPRVQTA